MNYVKIRDEFIKYPPFKEFLHDQKISAKKIIPLITPKIIARSGARDLRKDYLYIKRQILRDVIEPYRNKIQSESAVYQNAPDLYKIQFNFLKGMSFVDAMLVIPEFRCQIYLIRKKFGIEPKRMLSESGLTKEQIKMATYGAPKDQIDALLKKLGREDEIRERRRLSEKKEKFEQDFFEKQVYKKITKERNKKRIGRPKKVKKSVEYLIPKHQLQHVYNFILCGVSTGNLFSMNNYGKSKDREWERRLLGNAKKKSYISFLRYYVYCFHRDFKKEKSIKSTNNMLQNLGFEPFRREHDKTIRDRYESYFLK